MAILQEHYKETILISQISAPTTNSELSFTRNDIIDEVLRTGSENLSLTFQLAHTKQRRSFYYHIMLVDDYTAFRNFMDNLDIETYDFSGYYTIIITNKNITNRHVVFRMLSDLWGVKIVNAVLLIANFTENPLTVSVYSYFPYHSEHCGVAKPFLFQKILNGDTVHLNKNLLPNSLNNFQNCTLKAGTFEIRPFISVESTPNKIDFKIGGLEAHFIETVAEKLNFQIKYQLTPGHYQWGFIGKHNSTSLMKMIQKEQVDFGIASIALTKARHQYLQAGTAHYTTIVVFGIPDGRLYTPLEKLLRPFATPVWYALICCITAATVAVAIIQRSSRLKPHFIGNNTANPILNVFHIFFGNSIVGSTEQNSGRLLLFSWIYYCFVIRTVYQGLLFQYLRGDERWPRVTSISDINKERLTYHMTDITVRYFTSTPHVLNRTIFLPHESDTVNKGLEQLAAQENYGVIVVPLDNIAYHNKYKAKLGMVYAMKEPIATYPIGVHYPKKSPLTKAFDMVFRYLQPAGLGNYWAKNYGDYDSLQKKQEDQKEPTPLSNEHLLGCFTIFTIMNFVSILTFICELISRQIWMKKQRRV
ncbi:ionotropic receptor 21a-like [Topomyia yanbarensis]|uniref:ionotropic receptor 21a-like n=1 Tax=Topomyia yanbarensis TaxID=2498891 RepID=UPI00273AF1CA|nr:ionotropic receptor 21a-like [Topomyia yanbarensis]